MTIIKDQTCGTPQYCICGICNTVGVVDINEKVNAEAFKKSVENLDRLLEFAKRLP